MRLFGTDGIRGTVNTDPITPENVLRIGMAIGRVLHSEHGRNMVIIGKDTRISGYMIESALTSGICSMGMDVTLVGPLPTPGIAFLTRALRLDAGIVISASHNPFEDNGIKMFSSSGFKLPDEKEKTIEGLMLDEGLGSSRPQGNKIGKAFRLDDATGRYIEYIKSTIPRSVNLEGLKVVVDSANGAAYKVTPTLLRELGAEVISINDLPDGMNINAHCGSTFLDTVRQEVLAHKAHVGIAHDGDADRALFCDEGGNVIDGDMIMAVWARELKKEGHLSRDTVVSTVMSNLGLEHYLQKQGIRLIRTKVGDRYVTEEMLKGEYTFGGEQSGHIISLNHNTTGDGPITVLQVLYIMQKTENLLSKLASDITLYPQILKNVPVTVKKDIHSCVEVMNAIKEGERELLGSGRILVRPSGTEPKIRIMVEGKDSVMIREIADQIAVEVGRSMS